MQRLFINFIYVQSKIKKIKYIIIILNKMNIYLQLSLRNIIFCRYCVILIIILKMTLS